MLYWRYRFGCRFRLLAQEGSDMHHFVFKKCWPTYNGRGSSTIGALIVGLARGAPQELEKYVSKKVRVNLEARIIPVDPKHLWKGWRGCP